MSLTRRDSSTRSESPSAMIGRMGVLHGLPEEAPPSGGNGSTTSYRRRCRSSTGPVSGCRTSQLRVGLDREACARRVARLPRPQRANRAPRRQPCLQYEQRGMPDLPPESLRYGRSRAGGRAVGMAGRAKTQYPHCPTYQHRRWRAFPSARSLDTTRDVHRIADDGELEPFVGPMSPWMRYDVHHKERSVLQVEGRPGCSGHIATDTA